MCSATRQTHVVMLAPAAESQRLMIPNPLTYHDVVSNHDSQYQGIPQQLHKGVAASMATACLKSSSGLPSPMLSPCTSLHIVHADCFDTGAGRSTDLRVSWVGRAGVGPAHDQAMINDINKGPTPFAVQATAMAFDDPVNKRYKGSSRRPCPSTPPKRRPDRRY